MRIISQNRNIDVPYERIALIIKPYKYPNENGYMICASFGYDKDEDFCMGRYKTKERCFDIMSAVIGRVYRSETYYYMPKE